MSPTMIKSVATLVISFLAAAVTAFGRGQPGDRRTA